MDNNLKDYREKELKNYIIGNALIIVALSGTFDVLSNLARMNEVTNNAFSTLVAELISAGILSSILYTYVFIFDSIIPGNLKDIICNLHRPLPGEVIFEEMKKKVNDKRFTKEQVSEKYADVYEKLENLTKKEKRKASNSVWYAVYRKHENETKVFISNRDYLLCRDLCISTLYIGLMYFVLCKFSIIAFNREIVTMLIIELIATNIAMRSKQKRFVYNVIATDIHLSKEKSTTK
ncbi:MAG: hypothetical protein K2L07_00210 [Lachnospiraceae bacterium]|nr:hypothetical protein [Lachnospiraceae bacterium]